MKIFQDLADKHGLRTTKVGNVLCIAHPKRAATFSVYVEMRQIYYRCRFIYHLSPATFKARDLKDALRNFNRWRQS